MISGVILGVLTFFALHYDGVMNATTSISKMIGGVAAAAFSTGTGVVCIVGGYEIYRNPKRNKTKWGVAILVPSFCVAYLAGVLGLIWFDLHVLDLGDPKFRTSVDIYFPLWAAFYTPAVIAAFVFLWRSRLQGWRLWRLVGLYLALILLALEVSFCFDLGWVVLLLEFVILGLLFRKTQQMSVRIGYA